MPFPYSFDAVIGIFIAGYSEDCAPEYYARLALALITLLTVVMQVELAPISANVHIVDMRRSDAPSRSARVNFSDPKIIFRPLRPAMRLVALLFFNNFASGR